jgi:hypothetical protein
MGSAKFKDAVEHVASLIGAYPMSSCTFHLISWGSSDFKDLNRTYDFFKGSRQLQVHMAAMKKQGWGTDILAAFTFANSVCKTPDMILILTDGGYNGWASGDVDDVKLYIAKNKWKIFWLFTRDHTDGATLELDPSSAEDRIVVLDK